MIDFDESECNSIKSIVVKGSTTIDVTSRLFKGKMLMFAKLSIRSFVYDSIRSFVYVFRLKKLEEYLICI